MVEHKIVLQHFVVDASLTDASDTSIVCLTTTEKNHKEKVVSNKTSPKGLPNQLIVLYYVIQYDVWHMQTAVLCTTKSICNTIQTVLSFVLDRIS